jgi:metal-sulfur cluster biosynthetic enzyme
MVGSGESAPDVGGPAGLARNAAVGAPLLEHVRVRPGHERYWRALKEVRDPELPISVVDMGLIYDIRESGRRESGDRGAGLEVVMTFTATACPCMELITMDIRDRLLEEDGVGRVAIEVVWSPPWNRGMITDEGRVLLRQCGVAA